MFQNVFIFNVRNDTDVQGDVLNVSFSARRDATSFYSSKYLQNQVSEEDQPLFLDVVDLNNYFVGLRLPDNTRLF